jgi:toxin ParE1/3/4
MRITWSPEAIGDLLSLRGHIAVDDPGAAKRVALHIIRSVEELLSQNPQLGHPGRVPGTRELHPQNTLRRPYRVHHEMLQILRVYHHARRWPEHF